MIRRSLDILRALGPAGATYRAAHEIAARARLLEALDAPLEAAPLPPFDSWWSRFLGASSLTDSVAGASHTPADVHLTRWLHLDEPADRAELIARAAAAESGRIRMYSRWSADFGQPLDWHRDPTTGRRWPSTVHGSRVLEQLPEIGDVKDVWELGRFPHVFDLVRAYRATGDPRFPRIFAEHLRSFERDNPYGLGVHWASGQELAIRLFALSVGVAAFGEDGFDSFARIARTHAHNVSKNLHYARFAVPNNHLIGEAVGLWWVGALFPDFPEAERWRDLGSSTFLAALDDQFAADGGYVQRSHTYHRLALQYVLWFYVGAPEGAAKDRAREVMARSFDLLASFCDPATGRLPNYGPNDGADLAPWTSCDYTDFRPLLTALRYATSGARAFEDGPWDEALLWWFGPEALDAPVRPADLGSRSFEASGVHVVRDSPGLRATLVCGTPVSRFGHSDPLHVDVWLDGHEIAVDPGSYRYNDLHQQSSGFHAHAMSAHSHNTVTVDSCEPARRVGHFSWADRPAARVIGFGHGWIEGETEAWRGLGVTHRRRVELRDGALVVIDDLRSYASHAYRLHWLLADAAYAQSERDGAWTVELESGVRISIRSSHPSIRRHIVRASGHEGWISRYYGVRDPALSLAYVARAAGAVRLETRFEAR